jgi:tetratricopeptide (TPR) repeat protein
VAVAPHDRVGERVARGRPALDVGYLDGWLEAAPTRIVGAGWLTVLGPTVATVLGAGEALAFSSGDITVDVRAGLAALEYVTSFGEDTPTEAYNNLVYAYLRLGRLDDAVRFLPTALRYARKNPYLMHNAADVRALTGDLDGALKLLKRAKKLGYPLFDSVRTDEDLRALWGDPRFTAHFDD